MRYFLVVCLLLGACTAVDPCYQPNGRYEMVAVRVSPTRTEQSTGVQLDDPKNELDDQQIASTLYNVKRCLQEVELTPEERQAAWCGGDWTLQLRSCLVIKVPEEWKFSSCTGKQIFSCLAPDASCIAKGQTPTAECPCSCRAAIQDDGVIVTTPNLELLPWRLTELLSGCEQIQNVDRLSKCGSPSLVAQKP